MEATFPLQSIGAILYELGNGLRLAVLQFEAQLNGHCSHVMHYTIKPYPNDLLSL